MHITELRLVGFKSFVDPARAPIEQGLTGVVGPNGCGKSNLLEAVRWVMGATSAKSMRASDMDDVIFAGSAGRPAREHAEVTLVLADALGRAPAPFNKDDLLEVSRRIRRGLGSTYRINGKEVRAKDVQLLFADAATGANSPALVRQGQISELIAAKPQNRRRILEDAAGIAGLHARRHEADLKLKAAETNLARLDEVLAEIEAQAASLKKQARQAERYRGLAQTLRETEALLLHRRWSEAREREAEAQGHLREAERAAAEAAAAASAAERTAEDAREGLGPLREEELVAAAVLRRLEGVRVGLERDLAEAEAAIARCDAEAERNRDEAGRLDALKQDAEAALARLSAEADALGVGDAKQAQAALDAAQTAERDAAAKRAAAEGTLETLAAEAAAKRARAQALADAARAARTRLDRLDARKRELEAQIKALPDTGAFDQRLSAATAGAEVAQTEAAKLRDALETAEAALKQAEAGEEKALAPYRAAEASLSELEAEVRALEKLTPPESAKFPPVMASIDVDAGYERALAAALGDDLDASTNAQKRAHWSGADAPAPHPPPQAQSLALFVRAPKALAARIALIGVVDAKDGPPRPPAHAGLAAGFARRRSVALGRLRAPRRRRHSRPPPGSNTRPASPPRARSGNGEAALAAAKQTWEAARAARQSADAKARDLRAQAPRAAAAEAQAQRDAERLEAERTRASERRADLSAQTEALDAEIAEARAALRRR
ncbi:MAG: AAA family ATPase [Hyphomonadaceae bacterium]